MSLLGTRVVRVEDPALLTVGGKYVDDLAPAGSVYATFVRSAMAHAEITGIDTSDAVELPGVLGVYTAADLGLTANPPSMPMLNQQMLRSRLAADRVRYVGEPVAVVISETAAAGADAVDVVYVDYEPLPAVVTAAESVKDETLLFPEAGTNVVFAGPSQVGDDFFDGCEVTVDLTFNNQRIAPCPLEVRATVGAMGPERRWVAAPHAVVLDPGRPQHARRPGGRDRRRPRPGACDLPGCRWRLRRQERWLPRRRRGGVARSSSRPARPMGRDQVREHARPRARPRLCVHGNDRRRPRRRRQGVPGAQPPGRRRLPGGRCGAPVHHGADGVGCVRHPQDRLLVHVGDDQHGADGGVPRRRPARGGGRDRAHGRGVRRGDRDGPGGGATKELHRAGRLPVHDRRRHGDGHGGVRAGAREGPGCRRLSGAARRAGTSAR